LSLVAHRVVYSLPTQINAMCNCFRSQFLVEKSSEVNKTTSETRDLSRLGSWIKSLRFSADRHRFSFIAAEVIVAPQLCINPGFKIFCDGIFCIAYSIARI
jgi:hypothetical protein